MKKNTITQTILTGAVAMLGTTGNAQQGAAASWQRIGPTARRLTI